VVIYRRRASLQALAGPRIGAVLPTGSRALVASGGSTMQQMLVTTSGTIRALSTALIEGGPRGLAAQARRYAESVRAQLDAAIAEGQVTAAQTRQQLEERLAAAKRDPASARSAFK
jgi:hypothetical protein